VADVTVRIGFQNRYRISGINAAGSPAALDPNTPLTLEVVDGNGQILQSAANPDQVVITAEAVDGAVSHFRITADADPQAGVRAISLDVASTTTRNTVEDAVTVGMDLLGEEPAGTPA